jgi:hypothetical protein
LKGFEPNLAHPVFIDPSPEEGKVDTCCQDHHSCGKYIASKQCIPAACRITQGEFLIKNCMGDYIYHGILLSYFSRAYFTLLSRLEK